MLAPYSINAALTSPEENVIAYCVFVTGGSNHDTLKLCDVINQYFDGKSGGLQSILTEFRNNHKEAADIIFSCVKKPCDKSGLSKKCVGFTDDNCNTMLRG